MGVSQSVGKSNAVPRLVTQAHSSSLPAPPPVPPSDVCVQSNSSLYLHWLDLELADPVGNEEGVLQCFAAVEGSAMPPEEKTEFKQRKLQYVQEFGSTLEK